MPQPWDQHVSGRSATPFLLFVVLIIVTENFTFLIVPVGMLMIGMLSTVVHEMGHLLAGWSVGLRFERVAMGPIVVRRHGFPIGFRRRVASGFAYMSFPDVRRIRCRLLVFVAGGPFASLTSGIAALPIGEWGRTRYNSAWPTFLEFYGVYALFVGVVALIPLNRPNDGAFFRALCSAKRAKPLLASYGLTALRYRTPDGVNWNNRWVRLACADSPVIAQHARDWNAYSCAETFDLGTRAQLLERCLAGSVLMAEEDRGDLIAEATKFTAWDRNQQSQAHQWLSRLSKNTQLSSLSRTRMNVALCSAACNLDQALKHWSQGLELIQSSPWSVTRDEYQASWMAWRSEIEKRLEPVRETAEVFS